MLRFLRLVAHLFFPEQVAEHRVQVKIRHRVELTEVLLAGYPTGSDLLYPVGVMENKLGCSTGMGWTVLRDRTETLGCTAQAMRNSRTSLTIASR